MTRQMVLLGAGASADAGLPLTNQLAQQLLKMMQQDFPVSSPLVQALNFVYGAMVSARSDHGDDPLAAVNVETMISAIRLLRDRGSHEVGPFIQGWKPAVGAFGRDTTSWGLQTGLQRGVNAALGGGPFGGRQLLDAVARVIDGRVGAADNADLYADLERELLLRVRRLLRNPGSLDYLAPLPHLAQEQPGGLDVATLNYDLTVEHACVAAGVPVVTGIEQWAPGRDFVFEPVDGHLNLVKVHGSIDWSRQEVPPRASVRELPATQINRNPDFETAGPPAIVLGDRDKLGGGGPTLALLRAFVTMLARADHLLVVGYSFGDDHINSVIRDWINAEAARTITVMDLGWPDLTETDEGGFRRQVATVLGSRSRWSAPQAQERVLQPVRLSVMRDRAAVGLETALTTRPGPLPDPLFSAASRWVGPDELEFELLNHGPSMHAAELSTFVADTAGVVADRIMAEGGVVSRSGAISSTNIAAWRAGETLRGRLHYTSAPSDRAVGLTVSALVGVDRASVTFIDSGSPPGALRPARTPVFEMR